MNPTTNPTGSVPNDANAATTPFSAARLLQWLVESAVIHPEQWHALPEEASAILGTASDGDVLVQQLVELELLNAYQAARVQAGTLRGLILGNYRILNRIGAGGLGVVFEAEHIQMRRKVAIKVVPLNTAKEPELVARFLREIRAVAQLDHPNIVAAIDAGVCNAPLISPSWQGGKGVLGDDTDLYYFVTEFLSGMDLEARVKKGPLSVAEACALAYQAASALDAAHGQQLVHRDIKPANIFLLDDGTAKLLDFGLVRPQSGEALTCCDDLLGTLDFMAPEQARDASGIDIRADIFALGATLFFALVGRGPFNLEGSVHELLQRRQVQPPLSARKLREDVPEALDAVLFRMMALEPERRYATPLAVMHAMLPFLENQPRDAIFLRLDDNAASLGMSTSGKRSRVLVVEHDPRFRQDLARVLFAHGFDCAEAGSMDEAFDLLCDHSAEAVLIGLDNPETGGRDLLKRMRDNPPCPNIKVLMASEQDSDHELAGSLAAGAADCLSGPISDVQLVARVKAAIQHKAAQDQMDRLNQQLLEMNVELEQSLTARTSDLTQARNSLVLALARLVEYRSTETIAHLTRMQRYCVALAYEAASHPRLASSIDQEFIETLECVAPLHDIGNVGLPDSILLKAGPLDPDERKLMQTHTLIGAETLQQVVHQLGFNIGFLRMAIDVARHHHEHFDGSGYPDGLAGDAIPLAARIVALADAYDSLRSRRAQRPRLGHASAVQLIVEASAGKFDPTLLAAFRACTSQLDRIYFEVQDSISMEG